ncbi:hypothetical protein G5B40_07935 [Pikeienuella piscinae]|uniref:Flagellar motor switch protein FliN-like C-terminal domain-containing protein n=1 Tax=Pikeienuella piscinae TaxID=2748098 RepID=A0A7L5BUQ5_9RHOB|nr:FliM/FliN family flagellar motor switch protein [Pikeienuella piscinae]QIE55392.1 hypothetical protein G5B40_07935 [Pikeienuella piscinae]
MRGVSHATLRRKIEEARVSHPPLRDPEFVGDLFARLLEERLRVAFRSPVAASVGAARMAKLSDALREAENPALYGVAETPAGQLGGVLTLTAPLVHESIEAMTGAHGAEAAPDRMPTAIDEALVAGFAEDVIDCFEHAVISGPRPGRGVAMGFARFTRKASALAEAPDAIDTLAFRLSLSIGDGGPAPLSFIVPLGVLDMYRAAEKAESAKRPLIAGPSAPEAIWTSTMLAAVQMAEFRLIAVLNEMTLTVSEIGELVPGSIIPLPVEQRMEVGLRLDTRKGVAGAPEIAAGALGVAGGRRAVKIGTPPEHAFIENLRPYATAPAS